MNSALCFAYVEVCALKVNDKARPVRSLLSDNHHSYHLQLEVVSYYLSLTLGAPLKILISHLHMKNLKLNEVEKKNLPMASQQVVSGPDPEINLTGSQAHALDCKE